MKTYHIESNQVVKNLDTNSINGLSTLQAAERLKKYGPNTLPEKKEKGWFGIFIDQFKSPLIYILLCAAIIIFFVGDTPYDAFIISIVLTFNAVIGTIQEGRTAHIVAALKHYIQTNSIVVRDGKKITIPDAEIVIGDLVMLHEGQRVPADIRIIESNGIQVDQAVLTGESNPIRKHAEHIATESSLTEQQNMLFNGTFILNGSGKGIVIATGRDTEIGKIHAAIQEIKTDIPLRKDIEKLAYTVLLFILGVCTCLFGLGLILGKPIQSLIVMLTALFICVVPEGLPVVLTLILVSGVYRMARNNVLVKNMQAVETLGRTDVLVIDKTGTITRNEMMVSYIWVNGTEYEVTGFGYNTQGYIHHNGHRPDPQELSEPLMHCARATLLLNGSELSYDKSSDLFTVKGDPTEASLAIFGQKISDIKQITVTDYHKLAEEPFNAHNRCHMGLFETPNNDKILYVIGSPETILAASIQVPTDTQKIIESFLARGLRVVCCAYRILTTNQTPYNLTQELNNLVFASVMGIEDAIREGMSSIVAQTHSAGLKVIMATGDHHATALYIARKVDIFHEGDLTLDGTQLDAMNDTELAACIDTVTVFSRVTPLHKMRIIKALHYNKHIVAMTGDGTNDAPSLVSADLGIGMGHIGTEVAKQASDIILLDDSLASIITAIKQGRHILYTLKRVILYFFATNLGEILIILSALVYEIITTIPLPLPITAAQILWLNLVTDGFLDIALSMEPEEQGLLNRSWLIQKTTLIDRSLIAMVIFFAIPMTIGSLGIFLSTYKINIPYAQTMTLITMALFQWFNAWNCRSNTKSLFSIGIFSNHWLVLATSFVFLLQIAVVYVPFLQRMFNTTALTITDWLLVIAVASPIIIIEEIRKYIVRNMMPI